MKILELFCSKKEVCGSADNCGSCPLKPGGCRSNHETWQVLSTMQVVILNGMLIRDMFKGIAAGNVFFFFCLLELQWRVSTVSTS